MSLGVSVVICCHNSAKKLPETLGRLAVQQVSENIPWEIVVIDSSTDDTVETAQRCWSSPSPAPLRIVTETKLGIANARFRSFSEARHEIISFVDDDNWVVPDWIMKIVSFFASHPEAVAVGGPSKPAFETDPPTWFAGISSFYALGNQHAFAGDITDQPGTLLWGAGMSLRKEKALELVSNGFRFIACGGSSLPLKTGEDTELGLALRAAGGRLYYEPAMVIEHFMPAERLTWPKALRLMHTLGTSPVLDLFLIALDAFPYAGRPEWKKSWLFHMLKTLRPLVVVIVIHPMDCLYQPEGSLAALNFEKMKAQLVTLWRMRKRYRTLRNHIARLPWANIKSKAPHARN